MKSAKRKVKQLRWEQWIPQPIDKVFRFFSDEKNLELLTPPWLHFSVQGKSTPKLGSGTLINYRLSLRGIPLRWQSEIEEWVPPEKFVDRQTKGPYRLWHHTHTFEPKESGTQVTDLVKYDLYGGFLGNLLAGPFVRRDLKTIFEYRSGAIEKYFRDRA
jgi:ligand-binding SRPBCC domain-containing protein